MTPKRPRIAVRAIILNEQEKVLLIKRSESENNSYTWCLPGGKVDFGETAQQAMIKEIKEETDLDCLSADFIFYQDNLPSGIYTDHYVTLYFFCKARGEVKLNSESSDYAWVDQSGLDVYNIAFRNDVALYRFWDLS